MKTSRAPPESHINSQMVHDQPLFSAAKPPRVGPRVGPQTAPMPQTAIPYARLEGRYISPIEAPPVASDGEPIKPVRKRNPISVPKLPASAVGTWSTTKTASVAIYTGLRPICGISDIGLHNIGPVA